MEHQNPDLWHGDGDGEKGTGEHASPTKPSVVVKTEKHAMPLDGPVAKKQKIDPLADDSTTVVKQETAPKKIAFVPKLLPYNIAPYKSRGVSSNSKRATNPRDEEREGIITFQACQNDGTLESFCILTGLKSIFQKQLPNMPQEYISRLVLDRRHRSVAILKKNLQVVGGITYRPFWEQHFAEIVFCAITGTEQVKGYGSYLMNHLKEQAKSEGDIRHFLTYADNHAVGYFKKQGFTDVISLDKSAWVGYIKDYDGGTLMQCTMVPKVNYLEVKKLLEYQKKAIYEKLKSKSLNHYVYPGLKKTPIAIAEIPGVIESGWTPEMSRQAAKPKKGKIHSFLRPIVNDIQNHPSANFFLEPVKKEEVRDYYDVIKDPMDLKTLEEKVVAESYNHIDDFIDDMQKIFDNCRTYNPEHSQYYKCANRLEKYFKKHMKEQLEQYNKHHQNQSTETSALLSTANLSPGNSMSSLDSNGNTRD